MVEESHDTPAGHPTAPGPWPPVYQPIVDIRTGVVTGFEARSGLAGRVAAGGGSSASALRAAIDGAARLPHGAWLSHDVAQAMVLESATLREILAHLDRAIVLEISEREPIDDYPALRAALAALGPQVRIAVDEAGAEDGSFRHVVELRPQFVKLDRNLTRGIGSDVTRQLLVAGLRQLAEASGSQLVADGVETPAERSTLARLGLDLGQGALFGNPAEAGAWADRRTSGWTSDGVPPPPPTSTGR